MKALDMHLYRSASRLPSLSESDVPPEAVIQEEGEEEEEEVTSHPLAADHTGNSAIVLGWAVKEALLRSIGSVTILSQPELPLYP
jgi:hypothetical protein